MLLGAPDPRRIGMSHAHLSQPAGRRFCGGGAIPGRRGDPRASAVACRGLGKGRLGECDYVEEQVSYELHTGVFYSLLLTPTETGCSWDCSTRRDRLIIGRPHERAGVEISPKGVMP